MKYESHEVLDFSVKDVFPSNQGAHPESGADVE